jgi:hypothetical protein
MTAVPGPGLVDGDLATGGLEIDCAKLATPVLRGAIMIRLGSHSDGSAGLRPAGCLSSPESAHLSLRQQLRQPWPLRQGQPEGF